MNTNEGAECWTAYHCRDDGELICEACGRARGLPMYCCALENLDDYGPGHNCYAANFGSEEGHRCVTPNEGKLF